MPQRTNEFQDLVTLIQEALVPVGAKVTASAMVPGPSSGAEREIDILVETQVGPYMIKIAVEAKDEGRKLDATKIEAIIGKYFSCGGLSVNKVAVVAHRGFTSEAVVRARDVGIDLFTISEAQHTCWLGMVPQRPFHVHYDPMPHSVDFDPPLPRDVDSKRAMSEGHIHRIADGQCLGSPKWLMTQIIFRELKPNKELMEKMHEIAVNGKGKADVHITRPMEGFALLLDGKDYSLKSATFHMRYIHATGTVNLKTYTMNSQDGRVADVLHMSGTVGGLNVKFLFPTSGDAPRNIGKIEEAENSVWDSGPPKKLWHFRDGKWEVEEIA
jgi:hypothetical protein